MNYGGFPEQVKLDEMQSNVNTFINLIKTSIASGAMVGLGTSSKGHGDASTV